MSNFSVLHLIPLLGEAGLGEPKDMIGLLSRLFSPQGVPIVVVILGIFTALYTAVIRFLFERRLKEVGQKHAVELAKLQGELSEKLKKLDAELSRKTQNELQKSEAVLTEAQAKKQARLDYEYEARKRLYHECEPLVFELLEFAENAADRIRGLARAARQGDLPGWLSEEGDDYYIASTMYYLLAPVAVFKLMRRRLTIVDMTLDQNIATQYQLAKQIAWSFADDFDFAWGLKVCELKYTPNDPAWKTLRPGNEEQYWRQGLPYGRLDNAVESLIVRIHEPDGGLRVMGFGEFESELHKKDSTVGQAFTIVRDLFTSFHPAKRPVLWRVLVTQVHLYTAILRFHRGDTTDGLIIRPTPVEDRKRFYWKREPTDVDRQKMEEPFTLAEAYLRKNLPALWVEALQSRKV
jgi:hypothetical protein